jgi:hypothetical protein
VWLSAFTAGVNSLSSGGFSGFFKLGAHWIGSARLGTVQSGSDQANVRALRRNLSASETSYCRKTHKTLFLEEGVGLPHASDFRNVLVCPAFRNCSYTCRRGLCRAGPMQCAAFHLFPLSFISADCAVPSRADPIQCAPSFIVKPKPKPSTTIAWVYDSSFWGETCERQGCPSAVKASSGVTLVGIYAVTPRNCHGSNISIFKNNGFLWLCRRSTRLYDVAYFHIFQLIIL